MTDAEKCRQNGWGPGTRLVGDEGCGPEEIVITAVGEESILARAVWRRGREVKERESSWTLAYRDWKQVEP